MSTAKRIENLEAAIAAMQAEAQKPSLSLFGFLRPEDGRPRCRIWEQPGALTRYRSHAYPGSFGFHSVGCPMVSQGPPLPGSGPEEVERPCTTCPHWR